MQEFNLDDLNDLEQILSNHQPSDPRNNQRNDPWNDQDRTQNPEDDPQLAYWCDMFEIYPELFVANIPLSAEEQELCHHLHDPVEVKFCFTPPSKRFAFMRYDRLEDWFAALTKNQTKWHGFDLVVRVNQKASTLRVAPDAPLDVLSDPRPY